MTSVKVHVASRGIARERTAARARGCATTRCVCVCEDIGVSGLSGAGCVALVSARGVLEMLTRIRVTRPHTRERSCVCVGALRRGGWD